MITLTYEFVIKNGVFFDGFEASYVNVEIEQLWFQKWLFLKFSRIPHLSVMQQ